MALTELAKIQDSFSNFLVTDKAIHTSLYGTGGTPVSVIPTNGHTGVVAVAPGHVSTDNSTADTLIADEKYVGEWEDVTNFGVIVITVIASHASATNGLCVKFSSDGTNVDSSDEFTIPAATGKTFSFQAATKYYKVEYTNGGTGQSYMRLQTVLKPYYVKPSSHRIQDSIVGDDDAELVKSVSTGKDPDGTYRNVNVTRDGDLLIADNSSGLAIAKSDVTNYDSTKKFGAAPDFDTGNNEVTIWDGADDGQAWELMTYTYSGLADIDSISSSNNSDTVTIFIEGEDHKGTKISERVTLTGQTRKALANNYRRVYRGYNDNGTALAGHVVVYVNTALTAGVPTDKTKIRMVIDPADQQTEMAVFTVGANEKGYIRSFTIAQAGASRSTNYQFRLKTKEYGKVFRLKNKKSLSTGSEPYQHFFDIPLELKPGTDVEMTCQVLAASITGAAVSADFDIIRIAQNKEWEIGNFTYPYISYDTSAQAGAIHGISFNDVGSKMFVADLTTNTIYEYDLSNAWDPATATYSTRSFDANAVLSVTAIGDIWFKPDGTELYIADRGTDIIYQATLSTGFDLSTAADSGNTLDPAPPSNQVRGICISNDGTRVFLLDKDDNDITSYTMSVAWDMSSATSDSKTFQLDAADWESLTISIDGTKLYVGDTADDSIHQIDLSTAFDLDTAVMGAELNNDGTDSPRGLYIRSDGRFLAVGDGTSDLVKRLTV
jgi:sugar lactone lactonase YvrE